MPNIDVFKGKKVYCISDSDLDGNGCRVLSEYFIEPISEGIVYYNTGDRDLPDFNFEVAKEADVVVFTDLIPPTLEFYRKINKHSYIYIFDHHKTARDELGELKNYFFDDTICGTKIYYNFLSEDINVKPIVKEFVDLVDTYDCWRRETDLWISAKRLHNVLWGSVNWRTFDYETDTERFLLFIENQLRKFDTFSSFRFLESEAKIFNRAEKKEQDNIKEAKKNLQIRFDNEGNKYGYTQCTSKLSIVLSTILDENLDLDYIVGYSTWDSSNIKMSIRSQKEDFDVTKIAEKFGGGGHKSASGFAFDDFETMNAFREGKIHLI